MDDEDIQLQLSAVTFHKLKFSDSTNLIMRHSVIPSVTIYSLLPVKSRITDAPHETPKAHTMFMCVCGFF